MKCPAWGGGPRWTLDGESANALAAPLGPALRVLGSTFSVLDCAVLVHCIVSTSSLRGSGGGNKVGR